MVLDNWHHSDYKVLKHITNGGSSKIFLVELKDKKKAILKLAIEPKYINNKQIENEAYLLNRINHPSVPKLIDQVEYEGFQGVIMSLMTGRNLNHIIDMKAREFTWKESLDISQQLANIVSYFHKLDPYIVIRDIKPSNIVLDKTLNVQLVDFGTSSDHTNAIHNKAFGTIGYAAPEQFVNGNVHRRSDIYSLGATIYFIVTNGEKIKGNGKLNKMKHAPKKLREIVNKAVEKDIDDRYQNIDDLIEDLNNVKLTLFERIRHLF